MKYHAVKRQGMSLLFFCFFVAEGGAPVHHVSFFLSILWSSSILNCSYLIFVCLKSCPRCFPKTIRCLARRQVRPSPFLIDHTIIHTGKSYVFSPKVRVVSLDLDQSQRIGFSLLLESESLVLSSVRICGHFLRSVCVLKIKTKTSWKKLSQSTVTKSHIEFCIRGVFLGLHSLLVVRRQKITSSYTLN